LLKNLLYRYFDKYFRKIQNKLKLMSLIINYIFRKRLPQYNSIEELILCSTNKAQRQGRS
ncbi:hypothetical protein, partial [Formosa algae]|uniref:hypothetical protein n=1 Tax=Formosa algae TaxID=225843 RepID=UPI001C0EF313